MTIVKPRSLRKRVPRESASDGAGHRSISS
jgi:hypothetical protein